MAKLHAATSATSLPAWLIAGAVSLPLLAGTAAAQDQFVQQQDADVLRGDWIVGADVMSEAGAEVGSIDDILIAPDGTATAAVIEVGGFLGIGGKLIAVDWAELDIAADARQVTLALTEEQAENAPEFSYRDRTTMPAADDPMPVDDGTAGDAPAAGAEGGASVGDDGATLGGSGGATLGDDGAAAGGSAGATTGNGGASAGGSGDAAVGVDDGDAATAEGGQTGEGETGEGETPEQTQGQ